MMFEISRGLCNIAWSIHMSSGCTPEYDALLLVLGGAQQLTGENTDRVIFSRWKDAAPHFARNPLFVNSQANKPVQMGEPGAIRQTPRQARSVSSTPQAKVQDPRRSRRRGRPSLKKRELEGMLTPAVSGNPSPVDGIDTNHPKDEVPEDETSDAKPEDSEYVPAPLRWVKAPPTTGMMSTQALEYVFNQRKPARGKDANNDPYNAYAFGNGPREVAPFRPLHLIRGVKSADVSGWAENLRWATEQYATFGETGWTECPEHMDAIVQIRQEHIWASGELYLSIQDEWTQKEEDEVWVETMMRGTLASMEYREPHPALSVWGDIAIENPRHVMGLPGEPALIMRPWPSRR
ncbi:hypothetical protein BU23DRAFT_64008 [Bimuria novae-zelandiae CBS 107.79]|uniref:Uncharacterized protein n=1 Tax=Bimuria novae-zelandiae CBS 107.79 TaxID=1447943 RepID=A0A6A5UT88_9PLEO|nr:hypothetical protein BU23DRAFT_64008 [Bimuria novae-zelandiae CBS 107.79]